MTPFIYPLSSQNYLKVDNAAELAVRGGYAKTYAPPHLVFCFRVYTVHMLEKSLFKSGNHYVCHTVPIQLTNDRYDRQALVHLACQSNSF